MRKSIHSNKILVFFFIVFTFYGSTLFGQVLGDYKSVGTGNWSARSSWQYYNGSTWVTPTGTSPQGYPGQFVGTGAVLIQAGQVITADVSTAFPTGAVTINGQLNLINDATIYINSAIVIVNLPGTIKFNNKSNLKLPLNSSLVATTGTLIGNCSNLNSIFIDTVEFAVCNGSGSTGQTFTTLMASGGTLTAFSNSNAPLCAGNTLVLAGSVSGVIGKTTSGGTTSGTNFTWKITSPTGVITTVNTINTSIPISASGTYSIVFTCDTWYNLVNYSNSKTILVTPFTQLTPTVNTIDLTCSLSTGTATIVTQNSGDSYSFDNGDSFQDSNSKSGLLAGNYNIISKSTGGCSSPVKSIAINNLIIDSWNGSSWSTGLPPTSDQNIVFNSAYSSSSNLSACSCQVASGAVVINSNHTLKVTNGITVSGGSLTFENNASLIQVNNITNIGNITYKRTTSVLANNYDFVYWGSPVIDQKLGTIWMASNWNDTFYNFNTSINNWNRNYAADIMIPGKGYISRARNGQSGLDYSGASSLQFNVGGTWTAKFHGLPNNGNISVSNSTSGNYCLLSNPYPSAIDASAFLLKNNAVLGGTIYFWTHNTAITNNTYTSSDYAAFNGVGSTATSPGSSKIPSGKIAAGQAFFATTIASNNVFFDNSMRVDNSGNSLNNTQFFKTSSNAKTPNEIENDRVWLNLTNDQGLFKQMLIGYITGATNDFDSAFDGESMNGNSFIDFYSINQNRNFTIQGRALPFDENDIIPLGFKTTIPGIFKINREQADGLLVNQAVYIEDKVTNTIIDLNNGDYTFTTVAGTFNDRFVLSYKNKTLALDATDKENGILVFYSSNYKIVIIQKDEKDSTVNSVALFNMSGQNIANWEVKDREQNNIKIPIKNIPSGIYIVKVKTTKGKISQKIIVN